MVNKEELLEELTERHGEVKAVDTVLGLAVFRTATRAEYKRFRSELYNKARRADASEGLVRATVVHPPREEFDAWLDKKPGIAERCADTVLELAGMTEEDEAGKA